MENGGGVGETVESFDQKVELHRIIAVRADLPAMIGGRQYALLDRAG
jgi:hypothetical protein